MKEIKSPPTSPDPFRKQKLESFDRLLTIMDQLREYCPWDKKQTMESLRHLTIEEVYELSEAIIENDSEEVSGELGDILLHVVFYARIAQETGDFHLGDVTEKIAAKLIRRHPHIYGDTKVDGEEQVKANWESIKLAEKKDRSVLEGVPGGLPAMVKAIRIQDKARGVGFDWEHKEQVWEKVEEEMKEFKEAHSIEGDAEIDCEKAMKELGDLFFSLINYSRFLKIDPEEALERTNQKFIFRFKHMESRVRELGKQLADMPLEEMDRYWNEAKTLEK